MFATCGHKAVIPVFERYQYSHTFTPFHLWTHLGGGGWVFPGIFRGAVPPGSLNPNPISALQMLFSTPVFRLGVLNPYPYFEME